MLRAGCKGRGVDKMFVTQAWEFELNPQHLLFFFLKSSVFVILALENRDRQIDP